ERRGRIQGRLAGRDHRRNEGHPHLRTPGSPDRHRRVRLDGEEEARGLFLMNDVLVKTVPAAAAGEAAHTKGLLRFLTCGSVDDGKSTLIGRLLYDSKLIF